MTVGDIIEKINLAFGGRTSDQVQLDNLNKNIRDITDSQRNYRKQIEALVSAVDDKKAELKVTSEPHNQDILMDEIENLEKELGRVRDTAAEQQEHLNTLRALAADKQREINAKTANKMGANEDSVLLAADAKKDRDEKRTATQKALGELEKNGSKSNARKADTERAARMARILGERAPVADKSSSGNNGKNVSAAPQTASAPSSTGAEPTAPAESAASEKNVSASN